MSVIGRLFLRSLGTQLAVTLARPTFQITLVAQPIVMATIAHMVYRRIDGESNLIQFVVLGAGLAGIWSSLTFSSAGDISRERAYGTLGAMLITPSPLMIVVLGKIVANAILSTISLVVSFVYSAVILGIKLFIPYPLEFVLALVVFLLTANFFALALSTTFLLSRSSTIMQNVLEYPIYLLTGIFFSIELLPGWLQHIAAMIPLTWGVKSLRGSLQPNSDWQSFWLALGMEAGVGLAHFFGALVLFRIVERRVRVNGSLELM